MHQPLPWSGRPVHNTRTQRLGVPLLVPPGGAIPKGLPALREDPGFEEVLAMEEVSVANGD